jgi:Protein of unknown function (DUF3515)
VLVALAIGAATGGNKSNSMTDPTSGVLPPVTAAAPPQAAVQAGPCAQLLTHLPVQLGRLAPRVVHTKPDTPYVVAWGSPAVVLSCGVDRPTSLKPGSSTQFQAGGVETGPYYDVTAGSGGNLWTTVDRGPYISILVPAKYQGSDILPPLSQAIAKALPAVCSTDPNTPDPAKLCTRR